MSMPRAANSRKGNEVSSSKNAIIVNKKLVTALRSALKTSKDPVDVLASDRELLNRVTSQMIGHLLVYSKMVPSEEFHYKWFDSEMAQRIQRDETVRDKGRFVDACIIAYLYGSEGLAKYCTASKVIYPRKLSNEQIAIIRKKAAEIAECESVDVNVGTIDLGSTEL